MARYDVYWYPNDGERIPISLEIESDTSIIALIKSVIEYFGVHTTEHIFDVIDLYTFRVYDCHRGGIISFFTEAGRPALNKTAWLDSIECFLAANPEYRSRPEPIKDSDLFAMLDTEV